MKNTFCLECIIIEQQKELALVTFYSAGMLGCEEKDDKEGVILRCYFNTVEAAKQAEKNALETIPSAKTSVFQVKDQDWNAKWRETIEPVLLAKNVWISPKWHTPPLNPENHWIKIEPKMTFGTGHHETTLLTAQAICSIDISDTASPSLLDIGTGTGILCYVGDYAGYQTSVGIEIDPDCFDNIAENRKDNRPERYVSFIIGTVDALKHRAAFNTIAMNIIRTHSEPLLDICSKILKPGGHLVWSGILCVEKSSVMRCAQKKGWSTIKETAKGEWWCGILQKSAG
jgi:ribosomal protein L11 methyltransferase